MPEIVIKFWSLEEPHEPFGTVETSSLAMARAVINHQLGEVEVVSNSCVSTDGTCKATTNIPIEHLYPDCLE